MKKGLSKKILDEHTNSLLGFFKILADIKIRLNREAGRNGMEYVFEPVVKTELTPEVKKRGQSKEKGSGAFSIHKKILRF